MRSRFSCRNLTGSVGLRRAELLNSITQGIELKKAPEPEPEDAGSESSEGEPTPRRRGCAAATETQSTLAPCRLLSRDSCVRRDFMVPQHRARRMSVEDVMKDVMGGRRAMNAPESDSEASDISDISD